MNNDKSYDNILLFRDPTLPKKNNATQQNNQQILKQSICQLQTHLTDIRNIFRGDNRVRLDGLSASKRQANVRVLKFRDDHAQYDDAVNSGDLEAMTRLRNKILSRRNG